MSDHLSDDDDDILSGSGSSGLLRRVYKRQAAQKRSGRGGESDGPGARGRDRQAGRDGKFGKDAEFSAEERIRADMEADARARERGAAAIAALGQRLTGVKAALETLDGKLKDNLARAADPLTARLRQATADLAELTDEDAGSKETAQQIKAIGVTLDGLTTHIAAIETKIQAPDLTAALTWVGQTGTLKRFPAVRQEINTLHAALSNDNGVDNGGVAAAITAIEDLHTQETAALTARTLLRTSWAAAKLLVDPILNRVAQAAGRPGKGMAVALAAPLDAIAAADMPAEASDPARHQATILTIQNLSGWAQAAGPAINGFAYFDDVLNDGKQAYTVKADKNGPPPRIAKNTDVVKLLEDAALLVPFNAANFTTACNEVILFPGPWQIAVRRSNVAAAAQAAMQQAVAGRTTLSTFLQTNWGLALGAADALAAQFYNAYPNAEAVLTASAVTQATWNTLTPYMPAVFADLPALFDAIVATGNTNAAVQSLVNDRLARRGLTSANGSAVLASGNARLQGARGYPSTNRHTGAVTQGASVNLEWVGWMPARFAAERYWGAVHFHFNGANVATPPTMAHIKEYETQVVGGNGPLIHCTGTALAGTCLAPVQAAGFHL